MTSGFGNISVAQAALERLDSREASRSSLEYPEVFQRARDTFRNHDDTVRAQELQWELEATRLVPNTTWKERTSDDAFGSMLTFDNGEVWPDVTSFPDEQFEYYKRRAKETENVALAAAYSDILWHIRHDHHAGRDACRSYEELGSILRDAGKFSPDLLDSFTRPMEIAVKLGDAKLIADYKARLLDSIEWVANSEYSHHLGSLSRAVVTYRRHFTTTELDQVAEAIDHVAMSRAAIADQELQEQNALKALLKLRHGQNAAPETIKSLHRRLVESYKRQGKTQELDSPLAAVSHYRDALDELGKAGVPVESGEVNELEVTIQELLSQSAEHTSRFQVQIPLDTRKLDDLVEEAVAACGSPPKISVGISYFDRFFLIGREIESDLRREKAEGGGIRWHISHQPIRDDAIVHSATTDEEIFDSLVAEQFDHYLKVGSMMLDRFVVVLREREQWTVEALMSSMQSKPFLSQRDALGLEHALQLYSAEDYLAAVPLLVLELEPTLREVLPLLGLATTRTDRQKGITTRKNLEQVLSAPELQQVLGDDFVYYLRMTLMDQRGLALRHRVAHGVLNRSEYNESMANLMIYALLYLARYERSEARITE